MKKNSLESSECLKNDPLLPKIFSPEDLKSLTLLELIDLAQEIRQRIIDVLAINGGHLASNLGSVELTLALHTVFSSPLDRLIFDVSHQTYTHKIITGRNIFFDKIRKYKGLSGFCHPKESPHDHFHAGHAGTALSLALGMAKSRDILEESFHVIPIIGDATLTCGLSLEALNNISRKLKRFIIVLNDNEMSISHNVGGITNILSRVLNNPTTSKWAHEFEEMISKIPHYGKEIAQKGLKIAESVKNLVSTAPFFEQFGLSYIGPIDGHDLKKLITLFEAVKDSSVPLIIHLYTKKGYGLDKAEKDPISYHGAKPFDPCTCEFLPTPSAKATFPKIFGKHLLKMAQEDPHLVAVTPAMSLGSCLDPFMNAFPDRCLDVGIAEGHAVTFCGGLAKNKKLKVLCSIYATFLQRALDNLFHDVCLQELPIVFAIDRGGLSPADGSTHHGIYEIGFLKTMPNMVICQPRDGHLLKELLESAFSWGRPVALRYPNLPTEESDEKICFRPLGKAEILQDGEDLLIFAVGHHCKTAFKMAAILAKLGIFTTIVDPIFIKPLDTDLLGKLLMKHQRIVTLEEHSLKGGFGNEINHFLMSHGFGNIMVLNFGIPEAFLDQGEYEDLLHEIGFTPDKMVRRILNHFSFPVGILK